MAAEKTAIIFGVTGIAGRAIAERLLFDGEWQVIGVSRTPPEDLPGIEHIASTSPMPPRPATRSRA